MKIKSLLALSAALFLASCNESIEARNERIRDTKQSFAEPIKIGRLNDGREVSRVTVYNQYHDHYVYFVDNGDGGRTVSNNHDVSQGKTTVNKTIVEIDGIKYKKVDEWNYIISIGGSIDCISFAMFRIIVHC